MSTLDTQHRGKCSYIGDDVLALINMAPSDITVTPTVGGLYKVERTYIEGEFVTVATRWLHPADPLQRWQEAIACLYWNDL